MKKFLPVMPVFLVILILMRCVAPTSNDSITTNTGNIIRQFGFSIDNEENRNKGLKSSVDGVIDDTVITVVLPYGVSTLNGLAAEFTVDSGVIVTVDGIEQESGVTVNDFSNDLIYRVTGPGGTFKDYTIRVTIDTDGTNTGISANYSNIDATVNTAISASSPTVDDNEWTGTFAMETPEEWPEGLSLNESNGVITGTPTAITTPADYGITLTGTGEHAGVNGTATVQITVNPKVLTSVTYIELTVQPSVAIANEIAPIADPAGATVTFALTDGTSATTLPSGLSLNTDTGAIYGTVAEETALQDFTEYTIYVTGTGDWAGRSMQTSVRIKIEKAPDIYATYEPQIIIIRDVVNIRAPTVNPSGTATFKLEPGTELPAGLTLNDDGSITGTATEITARNTYNLVLTGLNSNTGKSGKAQIVITVNPKAIDSVVYGEINAVYDTAIIAVLPTKTPTDLMATYSSSDLPSGLSLDQNTGEITGTPTALQETATDAHITVTGTGDWLGSDTSTTVSITIEKKNLADVTDFAISGNEAVTALTGATVSATVGGTLTHTTDYTLSISPDAGGIITISNDGTITIGSGIEQSHSQDYTVTATGVGNYTGNKTGTFTLTVNPKTLTTEILGSMSPVDITQSAGITADDSSNTLTFDGGLTIGKDYSLSITGRPENATVGHVSLAGDTGVLTISKDIVSADSGDYTITATGKGNYGGTLTATFKLTVTAASVSVSYSPSEITANINTPITELTPVNNYGNDVIYSINPDISSDTGLSFNTATGVISGTPTKLQTTAKDYIITISGKDGTKYEGQQDTTTIQVIVVYKTFTGTFDNYTPLDLSHGKGTTTGVAQWSGNTETSVTYSIDNKPVWLSIDASTGAITVATDAPAQNTTSYTITATGTGDYIGSTDTATIDISIKYALNDFTLSYENIVTSAGTTTTKSPSWLYNGNAFTESAAVVYTITLVDDNPAPNGISISDTGVITVNRGNWLTSTELKVKCTAKAGEPWSGTTTARLTVEVYGNFRYEDKFAVLTYRVDESLQEQYTNSPQDFPDEISNYSFSMTNNSSKDITQSPININIDSDTGVISGKPGIIDNGTNTGFVIGTDQKSISVFDAITQSVGKYNLKIDATKNGSKLSATYDLTVKLRTAETTNERLRGLILLLSGLDEVYTENKLEFLDVSNITSFDSLFGAATDNPVSDEFEENTINDMYRVLFKNFNGKGLKTWDVSNVTSMDSTFKDLDATGEEVKFNPIGELSDWDVSNVTNMSSMFVNCPFFNDDISSWKVGNVTDMSNMFLEAKNFNQDLSGWDVRKVEDMHSMFRGAKAMNFASLNSWQPKAVTDMNLMFVHVATSDLAQMDLESWKPHLTGRTINMEDAFPSESGSFTHPSWYVNSRSVTVQ